jgi:hypothetical protein
LHKTVNKSDISKVHFFGVGNLDVNREIRNILGYDLHLSCDTSVIEIASIMGRVFINGKWKKVYSKQDEKNGIYHAKDLYDQNLKKILPYYREI